MQWILVANAARARVVEGAADAPLVTIATFAHEPSRSRSAQLGSDRPGWRMGAAHAGGAALAPRTDPHEREQARFAAELARWLEDAAGAHRYRELVVVAPEPFFGELKQAFGTATRSLLHGGRAVDLTHVGPAELPARLAHELSTVP
ncbi:MAG: host attachment protein [Ramlibacter sp.]